MTRSELFAALAEIKNKQIAHIKEHQEAFEAATGKGRDVDDYFGEYADGDFYLYESLCSDMGIEPKKELV